MKPSTAKYVWVIALARGCTLTCSNKNVVRVCITPLVHRSRFSMVMQCGSKFIVASRRYEFSVNDSLHVSEYRHQFLTLSFCTNLPYMRRRTVAILFQWYSKFWVIVRNLCFIFHDDACDESFPISIQWYQPNNCSQTSFLWVFILFVKNVSTHLVRTRLYTRPFANFLNFFSKICSRSR